MSSSSEGANRPILKGSRRTRRGRTELLPRPAFMSTAQRVFAGAAAALLASSTLSVPVAAQDGLADRVTVHGYLTQAYGTTSGVGLLGIPADGTADYRKLALLTRFSPVRNTDVVLQLGHRRMGTDIAINSYPNVTVDWAFAQQTLGELKLRAGRLPQPAGIYNEIRYLGTLLPFFRAPYQVYSEGFDVLDGVGAAYTLGRGNAYSLEWSAAYGSGEFRVTNYATPDGNPMIGKSKVRDILANQLFLNTPFGVRLGFNRKDYRANGLIATNAVTYEPGWSNVYSVDANASRATLRGEVLQTETNGTVYVGGYVQAMLRATEQLSLNAELGKSDARITIPMIPRIDYPLSRERAFGASYAFDPRFVLKAEHRWFEGTGTDTFTMPGAPAPRTRALILSVATAF
jgi:hypothetical protein